eukprot:TRINITY_DN36053_c0_g1_i1.p1 TRINITY_DN36053_c0_g1~~TRINITY_DN36053_c0_g1_i1.p1  ORF type:complete len:241 (-),score=24.47 TRINITY_DN36053_c0_g1_i1:669-1391(-)
MQMAEAAQQHATAADPDMRQGQLLGSQARSGGKVWPCVLSIFILAFASAPQFPVVMPLAMAKADRRLDVELNASETTRQSGRANETYVQGQSLACGIQHGHPNRAPLPHSPAECMELCQKNSCCCGFIVVTKGANKGLCELSLGDTCAAHRCAYNPMTDFYFKREGPQCGDLEEEQALTNGYRLAFAACLFILGAGAFYCTKLIFARMKLDVEELSVEAFAELARTIEFSVKRQIAPRTL